MIYLEYIRLKLRLWFLQSILWILDKLVLLTRGPDGRRSRRGSGEESEPVDIWQRHAERLERERAERPPPSA